MAWRGPTVKPVTNQAPNPINHGPEMSDSKIPTPNAVFGPQATKPNRAYNIRRDTDEEKDFSVTLLDVDTTILSYLDNVISPTIVDAGRQVKVPINYASPERWKAIRKDGGIRDKNGKVQCPVVVFRRTTMQRNDNLVTLNRYLQYPVIKQFSKKNTYDKFSVMVGFSPRKEFYSIAMPDHVIVNYDFIVWTDLVEQGNSIIEAINFATEDYWGDKVRMKFRTTISDYNFETSTDADQDRIVKTTFNMMVYAYLLPNRYENYQSTTQKAFSMRKVVFDTEVSVDNQTALEEMRQRIKAETDQRGVANVDDTTSNEQLVSEMRQKFNTKSPDFNEDTLEELGRRMKAELGITAGNYPDIIQYVERADIAGTAQAATSASYSTSASFINISGSQPTSLNSLNIVGGGATGSFNTNLISGVSVSGPIDTFPISTANSAMWLISISDGTNFKTLEIVANWDNININYYNTEVNQIGSVPVMLSVNNAGGNINLMANPLSGVWTIKMIRMII